MHLRLPVSPSIIHLAVYRLNSDAAIDAAELSYRSRPGRVSKLADILSSTTEEVHWHRKLSCALEQVLTFEVSCSPLMVDLSQCHVQWTQLNDGSKPGKFY